MGIRSEAKAASMYKAQLSAKAEMLEISRKGLDERIEVAVSAAKKEALSAKEEASSALRGVDARVKAAVQSASDEADAKFSVIVSTLRTELDLANKAVSARDESVSLLTEQLASS